MTEDIPPPPPKVSAWLQTVRGPYLNFLRNLTLQILLASLAWVLGSKLDFARIDLTNIVPTFGFFAFLFLFAYAVYSNISLFLSEVFPGLIPWVRGRENDLQRAGVSRRNVPKHLLLAALKERKLEFALAVFAIVMLQFVFAGVLVASIGAAVSLIAATQT